MNATELLRLTASGTLLKKKILVSPEYPQSLVNLRPRSDRILLSILPLSLYVFRVLGAPTTRIGRGEEAVVHRTGRLLQQNEQFVTSQDSSLYRQIERKLRRVERYCPRQSAESEADTCYAFHTRPSSPVLAGGSCP